MNAMPSLDRLKELLAQLPGVGRRSAERMAIMIARNRDGFLKNLNEAIRLVGEEIGSCSQCGAMTPAQENPCRYCTDPRRDDRLICVIEDPGDIELIERAGIYRGRYHALLGKLSPSRAEGPGHLRIQALVTRVEKGPVQEVILALNSDLESDVTTRYLVEKLAGKIVKITRLARGIPAGSGLAYADPVTLEAAMKHRTSL
jgi:recombination protein RecR